MINNSSDVRVHITALFGSQLGAARELDVDPRTVRYWCARGAAGHVINALVRLRCGEITVRYARRILKLHRQRRTIKKRKVGRRKVVLPHTQASDGK